MSRTYVLDDQLKRHDCVVCDGCGDKWTVEVAKMRKWTLGDHDVHDWCERCKTKGRKARGSK